MNADIAVGKMPTLDSSGITLVRITVHYTYREGTRLMSNVIAFHPRKSNLILLYEVVGEDGKPEWGGERAGEALQWIANSPTAARILVSAWDSDEEDAHIVGQPVDITTIVREASR